MKKNQIFAVIIGAVLVSGSTVSIAAASWERGDHASRFENANPGYLQGVFHGEWWNALHSLLNPAGSQLASITAPPGLLGSSSDTATATMGGDDEGILHTQGSDTATATMGGDDGAVNEDSAESEDGLPAMTSSDDAASDEDSTPLGGTLPTPTNIAPPMTSPNTPPPAIGNPMNSHGNSQDQSDESSDNSDD